MCFKVPELWLPVMSNVHTLLTWMPTAFLLSFWKQFTWNIRNNIENKINHFIYHPLRFVKSKTSWTKYSSKMFLQQPYSICILESCFLSLGILPLHSLFLLLPKTKIDQNCQPEGIKKLKTGRINTYKFCLHSFVLLAVFYHLQIQTDKSTDISYVIQ